MLPLKLLLALACAVLSAPSFTIAKDSFLKDGKVVQLLSGSIHYPRVPRALWGDRLRRLRAMGLNAVQTYVFWNFHEEDEGQIVWDGERDLVAFLKEAQDAGLIVLLRAGPYACGEWDFGAFPYWLLTKPNITLRTYDEQYLSYVYKFWGSLYAKVKPMLYQNGGPVVMVQVENEYGSYGDVSKNPKDKLYMESLVKFTRDALGNDIILYTTDGGNLGYMQRGSLPGSIVYTVPDFGPDDDPTGAFTAQKAMNAPGLSPPFCSELYSGWLTHWGEDMANTSSAVLAKSLDTILGPKWNGSINLYMGFGGTNFAFYSGANTAGDQYQPDLTSYDYGAPLSESGDHGVGSDDTDKFATVRKTLSKYNPIPVPDEPPAPQKQAYGTISLPSWAQVLPNLATLGTKTVQSPRPVGMEAMGQAYGFIYFKSPLPRSSAVNSSAFSLLELKQIRDRVTVWVDSKLIAIMDRNAPKPLEIPSGGKVLELLMENMGRVNYGYGLWDPKDIQEVRVDGNTLNGNWTTTSLPFRWQELSRLKFSSDAPPRVGPVVVQGNFKIERDQVADTFLSLEGWGKGVVWVNEHNIGRYWEAQGPQHTLYVPNNFLKAGVNTITVLELEQLPSTRDLSVRSADQPSFRSLPGKSLRVRPRCEGVHCSWHGDS